MKAITKQIHKVPRSTLVLSPYFPLYLVETLVRTVFLISQIRQMPTKWSSRNSLTPLGCFSSFWPEVWCIPYSIHRERRGQEVNAGSSPYLNENDLPGWPSLHSKTHKNKKLAPVWTGHCDVVKTYRHSFIKLWTCLPSCDSIPSKYILTRTGAVLMECYKT